MCHFLRYSFYAMCACALAVVTNLSADDTEAFFANAQLPYPPFEQTGDIAPPNPNYPNILFILDASQSMERKDGTGKSRLVRLQEAMDIILNKATGVNIGVMRFSHLNSGGRIIYPMSPIEFAREDALQIINTMAIDYWTPTVGAVLEAAYYWTGSAVYYGTTRAAEESKFHNRVHTGRVSHPESYTGGDVVREDTCTDANLDHLSCVNERIDGDPVYVSPLFGECQSNFQVLISDGAATGGIDVSHADALTGKNGCVGGNANTCGSELAEFMATVDLAPDLPGKNTVTTHTIGFNANISALTNIAAAGGGEYFQSSSAGELAADLISILNDAVNGSQSFVAPAITVDQSTRSSHREDIYLALFEPANKSRWLGNLKRYRFDGTIKDVNNEEALDVDTGTFKSSSKSWWSLKADGSDVGSGGAAARLPVTDRKVYTYTGIIEDLTSVVNVVSEANTNITASMLDVPANELGNLLKWARGVDTVEEGDNIRLEMGAPLHSNPTILNYGVIDEVNDSVVFVGTNDGYLHAINSQDGVEVFSFIPPELLPNLKPLFDNEFTAFRTYGLDGDLTLLTNDTDDTISGDDYAYLYMGMRRGGSNYTALDVTKKSIPKFMWSINGGSSGFEKLGQSWSKPTLGTIKYQGTDTKVLIFGGGYDALQDVKLIKSSDTIGTAMYMVNAETGALIWSASGETDGYEAMQYSIPSDPAVIDINGDGLTDQIYIGDMGGQVWRFDINNASSDEDLVSGGVIADLSGSDSANNRRFFNRPDVALAFEGAEAFLSVSIGSGNRAHPLYTGNTDRFYIIQQHDFSGPPAGYGIVDNVKSTDGNTVYRPLEESDLYDASENLVGSADVAIAADAQVDLSHRQGWFITLSSSGEKVLASSLTADNKIYFTTYIPQTSVDRCAPALGQGRVYSVRLLDAAPARGELKEDRYESLDIQGIPPNPVPHLTESGDLSVIVGTERIESATPELIKRVFWTEQPDY